MLPIGAYEPRWFMHERSHESRGRDGRVRRAVARNGAQPPRMSRDALGHVSPDRRTGRRTTADVSLSSGVRAGFPEDANWTLAHGETRQLTLLRFDDQATRNCLPRNDRWRRARLEEQIGFDQLELREQKRRAARRRRRRARRAASPEARRATGPPAPSSPGAGSIGTTLSSDTRSARGIPRRRRA